MTAPVFLVESEQLFSDVCRISGDEGRHAATVKRMRVGERLDVTDGQGNRASGLVAGVGRDWVELAIDMRTFEAAHLVQFTAIQAIAKGDRADLAIELLTEIGVDGIIPWQSKNSVAKWDASGKSLSKWQRVAREASKQSRRAWIPRVHDAISDLGLVLEKFDSVIVLHEAATHSLADIEVPSSGNIAIVIGPEGGISPEELERFSVANAHIVRMGSTVMRTSTAGGAALAVLCSKTSRWLSTEVKE